MVLVIGKGVLRVRGLRKDERQTDGNGFWT